MDSALDTRTKRSTQAHEPQGDASAIVRDSSLPLKGVGLKGSNVRTFEIGSFEIVRRFIEHVVEKNAATSFEDDERARPTIDWEAVEAAVANSRTLEQAIGRAVVIADQISRGSCSGYQPHDVSPEQEVEDPLPDAPLVCALEDPFFAFTLADVNPDFGDESRYRSKVRKRVARIFGTRQPAGPMTVTHDCTE